MKKRALVILALVLAGGGYWGWRTFVGTSTAPSFKLSKVESGPLTAVVSATGALTPVVSVQVSSQVSGQIREILVDFNSTVKEGQLIARIAPETFEHRVRQAEADLEAARATVGMQQAEILRARANLAEAERDFQRKKMLVDKNYIAPAERDKAQSLFDAAHAALKVVEAQASNAAAVVRQREAQLGQARVDLDRTRISAPVDGIVVKRSVEPGQTVAASLQAPEMFVIAKNLTDMQVEASIDEADIGRVKVGQNATFTVDAFPGRPFSGEVKQVRKAATVVSNVVSYTVVVAASNADLTLLPGMTANVRIVTAQRDSVLKVANAALRFRPAGVTEDKKPAAVPPAPTSAWTSGGSASSGRVWIPGSDGKPQAVALKLGLTDGSMTEILSGDLKAGSEVITGQQVTKTGAGSSGGVPGPRLF